MSNVSNKFKSVPNKYFQKGPLEILIKSKIALIVFSCVQFLSDFYQTFILAIY